MTSQLFDESEWSRPTKEKRGRQMTARELVALQIVEASKELGVSAVELTGIMKLWRTSFALSTLHRLWLDDAVTRRSIGTDGYRYFKPGKEPHGTDPHRS